MYSRTARVSTEAGSRTITTPARGYEVLRDPAINKGSAFDRDERRDLGLDGLLPPTITTELEPQLQRVYEQYSSLDRDLDKHVYMWRVHDNNWRCTRRPQGSIRIGSYR
jgi:malate dehydrogenase (oxaloacetate-decarboxylating)